MRRWPTQIGETCIGKSLALSASAVSLLAGAFDASAADAVVEISPDVAIARGWSGCYVGANVGYASGDDESTNSPFVEGAFADCGVSWNSFGAPYETIGADGSGAIGGIEAGCDYEVPLGELSLVVGAAADFSVLDVSGDASSPLSPETTVSFDTDWAATSTRAHRRRAAKMLV